MGVAVVALPEVEDPNAIGAPLGLAAGVFTALAAVSPGRRMPDWAVGLGRSDPAARPAMAPLLALGWALAAIAGGAAWVSAGALHGLFAALIGGVVPAGLLISLQRFLRGAEATRAWALERGVEWAPEGEVPEATPLLREGTYTYALNTCSGELAPGLNGSLMHLGSVRVDESPEGSSHTTRRFTVVVASVPDPGERLRLCVCAPRSRVPGYDALDGLLKRLRRIDLESIDFERRYELAIEKGGDESWLRRLFEPTFTEQLALPDGGAVGWELENGTLAAYRPGYATDPAELDRIVGLASLVAARVRDEVGVRPAAEEGETGRLSG